MAFHQDLLGYRYGTCHGVLNSHDVQFDIMDDRFSIHHPDDCGLDSFGTPLAHSCSLLSPFGVAFDEANIWVANSGSGNVTKLRASDGTFVGQFVAGAKPYGVAFDGANIWVTNSGSGTVAKLLG
jgi:hypothetical protein